MKKTILVILILIFISNNSSADLTISVNEFTASTGLNTKPPGPQLFLALGDSKTQGWGDAGLNGVGPNTWGYRKPLQTLVGVGTYRFVGPFLTPPSDPIFNVNHDAVGGTTSTQILSRLVSDLPNYFSGNPSANSIIMIDAGTNDCAAASPNITVAVNNILAMVNNINNFNPNIIVYVMLTFPSNVSSVNTCIDSLNPALKTALINRMLTKPNLHFIDMNAGFKADPSWSTDYMFGPATSHANSTGYSVEAGILAVCINNTTQIYCDGN